MDLLLHILLLLCLCLQFTVAQMRSLIIPNYGHALTAAVAEIIGDFYVENTNTVNIFQAASSKEDEYRHDDMINEILHEMKEMDVSVRLEHKNALKEVSKKRVHNIVFVDSYASFMNFFGNLSTKVFEYQGYYLIVLTTYTSNEYSVMSDIFGFLWKEYIINANIIWKVAQNNNEAFMYTYFPFTNFYCGMSYPVQLNQYSSGRWLRNQSQIFPNKMSNLHKCPLTAVVVQTGPFMKIITGKDGKNKTTGIDGTVLRVISELMNFTLNVISSSEQGGFLKNGTATGAGKFIINGKANLSIGYISMTAERNDHMKPSNIYYTSNLIWIVPNGRLYSAFEKLAKPFTDLAWICILSVFAISFAFVFFMKYQSPIIQKFIFGSKVKTPSLNIANIFFGGSLHVLPSRNFSRTLVGLFLLYSLVIRSSYQGALYKFMKGDFREDPVNDLKTMVEQDFTFYVVESSVDYVKNFPEVMKSLKVINRSELSPLQRKLATPSFSKGALLSSEEHVAWLNSILTPYSFVNYAQEVVTGFNLCIYTHVQSCLIHEINKNLINIFNSGLLNSWTKAFVDRSFLIRKTESYPEKLDNEKMSGAYQLLFIGLSISLAIFVGEVIYGKNYRRPILMQ